MQKTIAFITLILLIMSMISSCGASHDATGNTAGSPTPPVKNEASGNTDDTTKVDSEDYERKIIKTYHLSLETKNYDSARDAIAAAAQAYGGYISESNEKDIVNRQGQKDRSASFTVRIPSEKAEAYVSEITKNVSVLSKKLSTEDITTSYYDLQSQLESLAEQEARIKKLMDEATNYNYLLELDDKLTSIRAQINNISKQIQIYDKSVALSFVYITLDEVVEYTEISEASPSFGKRIADAFTGTFENFVKFCQEFILAIIWMLPAIIIGGGVTAISIPLIRRRDKKRRESLDNSKKDGNAEENKR